MRSLTFFILHFLATLAIAEPTGWEGEWITDLGVMQLSQSTNEVSGSYGKAGSLEGTTKVGKLVGTYKSGNAVGKIDFAITDDGRSFQGTWRGNGNSGSWRGWRPNPEFSNVPDEPTDFSGAWLSTSGTMVLQQNGDSISGTYGAQGWGTLDGKVVGPRLVFDWKYLHSSGKAWIEQTPGGDRIFGRTESDTPSVWTGVRVDDFPSDPTPMAGKTIQGRTENGMLYFLRMPDDWNKDATEPTDLIVLLHGSNWTTKGMVHVTATKWPKIGRQFAILGIQGERWAKWSEPDDLRFNYSYVNWMGRSTYGGFPNTDRESPYLVMNVIDELREKHNIDRIFVGGHSQGGYLTYLLHMHYADKLAGTFPVAGGMVMQAEPDVFDDEKLQISQRATPMAIVHGTKDRVVSHATTEHIQRRLLAHNFHRVRLFSPAMGHPYDFQPIGDAIEWLDTMSSSDSDRLLKHVSTAADNENWQEVACALSQAAKLSDTTSFEDTKSRFETAASEDAEMFQKKITANEDGKWIDDFLIWKQQFATAKSAKETMAAFEELQKTHDVEAKKLYAAAGKSFRSGARDDGWGKYQEIIDKYYASRLYTTVKSSLAKRK